MLKPLRPQELTDFTTDGSSLFDSYLRFTVSVSLLILSVDLFISSLIVLLAFYFVRVFSVL